MANRSFLLSHDFPAPLVAAEGEGEAAIVAAASNQIPLLWLSIFNGDDLKTVQVPLEDAEGNESIGPVPTLHAPIDSARATYHGRRGCLMRLLPDTLLSHLVEWEALLSSLKGVFVQVDLAEIWMMFTDDEFRLALAGYLAGLDGTSDEGWAELADQAALEDEDVARYGLRGYQWEAPVPWNE